MNKEAYAKKLNYNNEYNKQTYKAYTFRLHKINDADLIDCLDQLETTAFIKSVLKEYLRTHEFSQHLKSGRSAKLGMPYEVYEVDTNGNKSLLGSATSLSQAKAIREYAVGRSIIIKRYMNKYGNVVGIKVNAK